MSLREDDFMETIYRSMHRRGVKDTIKVMVDAMTEDEAVYLLNLILDHGDFDERE